MAAGAPPWKWCCRLGTRDARGKDALKAVSAGAECQGHVRYKKKRQWSITSEKNLDAFFAAEAVALLTGVNPEDADPEAVAAALKAAVAPVFRVDTARVCKPCWKAALSARLAGASVVGSAGAGRGRGGADLAARTGGRRGALSQVAARRVLEGGWGGGDRPRGGHLARGAYWGGRLGGGGPLADGAPRAAPSEGGENGRVGGASVFGLVSQPHRTHLKVRLGD